MLFLDLRELLRRQQLQTYVQPDVGQDAGVITCAVIKDLRVRV